MKKHFNFYFAFLKIIIVLLTFFSSGIVYAANDNQSVTQERTVNGVVIDKETGEVLLGVSVKIKGTSTGTVTDINGNFSINVGSNTNVLVFSFLGKKTQEITVGTMTNFNIHLENDTRLLQEVVIQTGYMTQKKADLTGSLALASSKDIELNPQANVMKSLQGKLPGVRITSDGNPAENVTIRIRGLTSITRSSDPLVVVDGQPVNINFRDINTLDIESIQVLKDGASASVYGARAASGVILIETKKAKEGISRISYDGQLKVEYLANMPKMLNTEEFGRAIWQATVNDGDVPETAVPYYTYEWHRDVNGIPVLDKVTPIEWLNNAKTMPSANTDWWKEQTQPAVSMNHQLTLMNGTNKARSMYSLNYYDRQGTVIHSYMKRITGRMNTEFDLIKDRLKAGQNVTGSYIRLNGRNEVYQASIIPPILPVHTTDGGWGGSSMSLGMNDFINPIRNLEMNKNNYSERVKILGSTYMILSILKNLHVKTQLGIDYTNEFFREIERKWLEGGGREYVNNGVTNRDWKRFNYTWTNTLTYNLKLSHHTLDVLLGQEMFHETYSNFSAYRRSIEIEDRDYAYLSSANGTNFTILGDGDEEAILSFFGKFNYSFDNKYLLSGTLRYDGSSKFGANNRYGFFPAFSAGWRIKNESFFEGVEWLSDLKLRTSWGINGNSNIPSTALINTYSADYNGTSYSIKGNDSGALYAGYRRTHLGNPNMKWEATTHSDVGIDFGLFNNQLTGSIDYFYKITTDMLFEPNYIGSLGEGGYQWVNSGDMSNWGLEFSLGYNKSVSSDFRYAVNFNWSFFRNKIVRLMETVRYQYGGNGLLDDIIGRPRNSYYGLVTDGLFLTQEEVDNSPQQDGKGLGRIRYKDLDGDGRINETYDRTWLGTNYPQVEGGFNFEMYYKNFDFTVFFQGEFGAKVYNNWKEFSDFWNITVQNDLNHPKRILEAWSPSNPNSDIPALSRRNLNGELRMSDYFLENGSYVKLRTLELGYTLPRNISDKLFLQKLRVYFSGQNLLTFKKTWGDDAFTGPDPENPNWAYRVPLGVSLGINVSF